MKMHQPHQNTPAQRHGSGGLFNRPLPKGVIPLNDGGPDKQDANDAVQNTGGHDFTGVSTYGERPIKISSTTKAAYGGPPVVAAPASGAAPAAPPVPTAPAPAPATAKPSLSLSNDTYSDTATESHKNISFDVTVPSGLTAGDYALVNHLKGCQKDGSGTFFKVKMYESMTDFNFSSFQVDSVDKDPIYWSTSGSRWNYTTTTTGFNATDDPGPALNTEHGALYAVHFKIGLYKLADLPATTTGSISATPIAEKPWQYSVKVDSAGKFTHPTI